MTVPLGRIESFVLLLAPAAGLDPALGSQAVLGLLALATARWLPVVVLSPVLGGKLTPSAPKMGLAVVLALVTLPHLGAQLEHGGGTLPVGVGFWCLLLEEAFVGVVLGFGSSLVFWAADSSGRFLDNIRGTTSANLLNPHVRVQTSLLGGFYFHFFLVLYMASGGHRWLLEAIFDSYRLVPALEPGLGLDIAGSFIAGTAAVLSVAVRLVAPPLVALVAMDVMFGVANRMAPQLNVYFLSLPLKSAVGALVAALGLFVLVTASGDLFRDHHHWLADTVGRLGLPDS